MISIIPKPLKCKEKNGHFIITNGTTIGGAFSHAIDKLVGYVEKAGVSLKKDNENSNISFVLDEKLSVEEYALNVTEDGIIILASSENGAFYASQTLRQILLLDTLSDVSEISVPCVDIIDKPRFSYRSFMLDVARHFYDKDVIKQYLDMMALHKLNTFHWHLTEDQGWRIEIKKYPLLTEKGAIRSNTQLKLLGYNKNKEEHDNVPYGEGLYFTQDDVREIVEYAKDLHINVVPEIDMPGHLVAAISCYPELSCEGKPIDVCNRWGVMKDIGCVGGDKLLPFIKDILDEVCELFPYEYFHIGGDEVPKDKWKKCPKCQAKIKELGLKNENELQGWFNNEVLEYLKTKGKKLIGWNEILEAGNVLSNETIVQWWIGNAKGRGVYDWMKKGNKIVMSPCNYIYCDHFYSMKDLKKTYSIDLDTMGLDASLEHNVLGIEAPMWTEYVRDVNKLQFNTYPRLQALAEINWTSKANKDFSDFEVRLASLNCILDKYDINYATKDAYLCDGFKGFIRKLKAGKEWLCDSYTEFEKYSRKKDHN